MVTLADAVSFWQRLKGWGHRTSQPDFTPEANAERRVWVRFPADLETALRPTRTGSTPPLAARVQNISRGGINLIVSRHFETGELLTVELPGTEAGTTYTVLACIVHVAALSEEMWRLGCTFSGELSTEDLAAFGAQRKRPTPPDQRTWERFPCAVKATYELVEDPKAGSWPADVLNLSASGIGLLVNQPIETGMLLDLRLLGPGGRPGPTLLACVVHVQVEPSGGRALGCDFIRQLNEKELRTSALTQSLPALPFVGGGGIIGPRKARPGPRIRGGQPTFWGELP